MTNKRRHPLLDMLIMLGLLALATIGSYLLGGLLGGTSNAQMLFLLAVLLISRLTEGYWWGIIASVVAVPLVNYMFTYPYFSFNLSISGYLLTFVTMLTVSIFVSVLTTQIQKQQQMRIEAEMEKLRANLLRAVSHDLRTPLTCIVGTTDAILDNALPVEKQRELLRDVNSDAQWLLRMVENLLAITRIQRNEQTILTDVEVVEDVLAEAVIKFNKHFAGTAIDMQLSDEIILAQMDAVLIVQVVLNLLENAVYHGKTTSLIRLSAQHDGRFVTISVEDNGEGIPREKLPHIFNGGMSSGDNADAQKHMGIGLSVCKSIVEAHGGHMEAFNLPHGGACFRFTLPEKENDYGDEDFDR